ncbi:MAG: apolipoprotein N-acyltransferase [Spirochaetaceae bacterium]|nr:apolipoprotein N-acyltransferase [Spirochaetaceae bacterium]
MALSKKINLLVKKVLLVFTGTCLYVLCQPNVILQEGVSFLAFIALVPAFILAVTSSLACAPLWGLVYGILANGAVVIWLGSFSEIAFVGVLVLYACIFAILFLLLNIVARAFKQHIWLPLWILYLGYEYAKTLGFFGFTYGILAYSQWKIPFLVRTASLFGVWGLSALIVFPSAFIANFFIEKLSNELFLMGAHGVVESSCRLWKKFQVLFFEFLKFCKARIFVLISWACFCMGMILLPPLIDSFSTNEYITKKIALVQPNSDPWKSSIYQYKKDLEVLCSLSEQAMSLDEQVDLVVWPETAFVPRIKWHYRFREDHRLFGLVDDLLHFIDAQKVPFLIGNDEALYDSSLAGASIDLEAGRVDYNAALLFEPQKTVIPPRPKVYYKQHLVPLTESFPYKDMFPQIYQFLLDADTHLYEAGTDAVVFDCNGIRFSVPICFEDTFGTVTRAFAQAGAQLLVGISNDAWSKNQAAQFLHVSTSVFRAAEVGLPLVRSTADGITCSIDRTGKIIQKLEASSPGFLIAECMIPEKPRTLYYYIGDVLGNMFFVCSIACVIYATFMLVKKRKS